MASELAGKVAIITGGARGMGEASARRFVEEGARVVIADIRDDEGNALAEALGDAAVYLHVDVTVVEQVAGMVAFAVKTFGRLDTLFSNAGVMGNWEKDFLDEDFATFQSMINIDLLAPLLGAKYAGLHMRDHGGGSIISSASTAALYGGYGIIAYRAAKAGVVGMTKSLAIELGRYGIRVNCISPGPTRTPIFSEGRTVQDEKMEALQDIAANAMLGRVPLGRIGLPEDIANAAVFLASDRAAQINGINLMVDGGESVGNVENTREKMQIEMARFMGEK